MRALLPLLAALLLTPACGPSETRAADPSPWRKAAEATAEALDLVRDGLQQGVDHAADKWETEWRIEVRQSLERVHGELEILGQRLQEAGGDAKVRLREASERLAVARKGLLEKLAEGQEQLGEEWGAKSRELQRRMLEMELELAELLEKRERSRSGGHR